jgi:hypothetical protein
VTKVWAISKWPLPKHCYSSTQLLPDHPNKRSKSRSKLSQDSRDRLEYQREVAERWLRPQSKIYMTLVCDRRLNNNINLIQNNQSCVIDEGLTATIREHTTSGC